MSGAREGVRPWQVFASWYNALMGDSDLPPDEPSHEWEEFSAALTAAGYAIVPVAGSPEIFDALRSSFWRNEQINRMWTAAVTAAKETK
jgi:hypothetical protein